MLSDPPGIYWLLWVGLLLLNFHLNQRPKQLKRKVSVWCTVGYILLFICLIIKSNSRVCRFVIRPRWIWWNGEKGCHSGWIERCRRRWLHTPVLFGALWAIWPPAKTSCNLYLCSRDVLLRIFRNVLDLHAFREKMQFGLVEVQKHAIQVQRLPTAPPWHQGGVETKACCSPAGSTL